VQDEKGRAAPAKSKAELREEEDMRLGTGPQRLGGDLRYRRGNLFTVANVKRDRTVTDPDRPFESLGLKDASLLKTLKNMGLEAPTRIQAGAVTGPLLRNARWPHVSV
jgi:hypothetical protein